MNEEEIKRIIEEYLKGNLRLEAKSRYLDEYSSADNYITVYLGDEIIQEVSLYELDFSRRWARKHSLQASKDGRMIQAKGKDSVHYKGTEIQRSYIPRLINLGFTRKEISEIMNLGVQLVSDYYNKYKETYG